MRRLALSALLFCWVVADPRAAVAQEKTADPTPKPDITYDSPLDELEPEIKSRQQTVKDDLRAAEAELEAVGRDQPEQAPPHLKEHVELLKRVDLVFGQQLLALEQIKQQATSRQAADAELLRLRTAGPAEPKPYSFSLLERLRDDAQVQASRMVTLEAAVAGAGDALTQAREEHDRLGRERRQAREALDKASDEAAKGPLAIRLVLAESNDRLARERVRLRGLELRVERAARDLFHVQSMYTGEKLATVARDVHFSDDDLQAILAERERAEFDLRNRLDRAQSGAEYVESQWFEARQRLDRLGTPDPALVEEVEAKRLARETSTRDVSLLNAQLQRLSLEKTLWGRRHQVANRTATKDDERKWLPETKSALDQLQRERSLQEARTVELRNDIAALEARTRDPEVVPGVKRWVEDQIRQLQRRIAIYQANMASLDGLASLHRKLLDPLSAPLSTVTIGERLSVIWSTVVKVWTFEVFQVEERPITVGKMIVGLFLLTIGFTLSRRVSQFFGRRFLPRLGLNEGAAGAVQSLLFYVLLLTVALLALRVASVPLTVFTLLGGAVAIGIGFGSQNIMNNFISGLIMLAERPVRVGDMIQVGDLYGNIERIGARSTRVKTGSNLEIIVPNSSFLENNVINWTLSDNRVRVKVVVGVAYGSPTRDVARLMAKAVHDHGKVLKKPEPIVLFQDFGDNSLLFEIHFWLRLKTFMDTQTTQSDVRFRIDTLFREAGITIAFPQRDVHLDTLQPLEVRMVGDETSSSVPHVESLPR